MSPEPTGPEPRPVLPRSTTILLTLAGATIAAFGLSAARGVFTPVFLAFVLTLCVHPLRHWMQAHGIRRGVATGSTIVAVFALLAGLTAILITAIAQFSALLPQYADQLGQLGASIAALLEKIGFGTEQVQTVLQGFSPSRIISFVAGLLGNITAVVGILVIILTTLILMAIDGSRVPALLTHLEYRRPSIVSAFNDFATGVRRYMVATTILGAAQGLINWLVLLVLQVPGALLWGLLSFICSFIPNIGYFIAIVPPLFFGFLTGGWPTAVAVIVFYGVFNSIIQSIIQPKFVGNAVALSETLTFVSVLFWALVLGPVGAILAVPLTLLARTILLDSDPSMAWWRPFTGDRTELKALLEQEDHEIRARRRRGNQRPEPDGSSKP